MGAENERWKRNLYAGHIILGVPGWLKTKDVHFLQMAGVMRPISFGPLSKYRLGCEREQNIAGHASEAGITRVYEYHSLDDHGPGSIHRAAFRLHAVDRVKFSRRVKIPKNRAIFSIIATNMPVVRSRKYDAGNSCHCRGLRGTTANRRTLCANDGRSVPNFCAVRDA